MNQGLCELVKKQLPAILDSLKHSYTQIRVAIGIGVGGGIGSVIDLFNNGTADLYTKVGRHRLYHAFISGSVVAVLFHFAPTPIKPGTKDNAELNDPKSVAPNCETESK